MGTETVKVPDIGSDDPVDIIELLVKEGDKLAKEDSLMVLESAKASVEVPSPVDGKVTRLLVKVGDRVNAGDPLMEVETDSTASLEGDNHDMAASGGQKSTSPPEEEDEKITDKSAEQTSTGSVTEQTSAAGGTSTEVVTVPDIGSDDPVDVIELLVKEGDKLAREDSLMVLESAKASVEVPSPLDGEVAKLLVREGDRVQTGDPLLEVTIEAGSASPGPVANKEPSAQEGPSTQEEPSAKKEPSENKGPASQPSPQQKPSATNKAQAAAHARPITETSEPVHAGPAVRKLAREMGVDLAAVPTAGGKHGRIIKEDVHAYIAKQLQQKSGGFVPDLPDIDFSQFGDTESVPTSKLRQTAAQRLQQSWNTVPQVTQHELADITDLESFRKTENQRHPEQKLTMLAFVARAVVGALQAFPDLNSSLSNDYNTLILKHYIHLGFAVDTDRGLLVPVLRDANKLGVREIAQGVAGLAQSARDRKLLPKDMQGASFTLSSLGGIGGTHFTPLVNWPEVGILGIGRADWQPVWDKQRREFAPRLMLPLSLSYDHRVIDGAAAARFIVYLRDQLADLRRLLL